MDCRICIVDNFSETSNYINTKKFLKITVLLFTVKIIAKIHLGEATRLQSPRANRWLPDSNHSLPSHEQDVTHLRDEGFA